MQPLQTISEVDELKDRLLRLAAEFDNYKKRVAKEIEDSKNLGKVELIKKMLPALDEFELAITAINNNPNEGIRGIGMVYSNFLDALMGDGLRAIDSKGKSDPYKHEIIMTKESEKEEGTILEVVRKGYTFKEILIRPASVIVSKGKEKGE
ncbi:MAG: nucleotide exchange factor GrpE [Candidatus Micrarchaeales archaeon]